MPPPTSVQASPGILLGLPLSVPTTRTGKEEETHTENPEHLALGQDETTTSFREANLISCLGLKKDDTGAKLERNQLSNHIDIHISGDHL